jgi:hypothetical protein
MEERRSYQLMCTYLKGKYFISTIYRQASTIQEMWYFETMAWEWDDKTKERGHIIEMEDSGVTEESAIRNHTAVVQKLHKSLNI